MTLRLSSAIFLKERVDCCYEVLFEICEFDLPPRNALDLDFQTDVTSLMNNLLSAILPHLQV